MLNLSKSSLPVVALMALSITGWSMTWADGLNIYMPENKHAEEPQNHLDNVTSDIENGLVPVNYPALTPASSLLDVEKLNSNKNSAEKKTNVSRADWFPTIYQRNQIQPDVITPEKDSSNVKQPVLKISAPPSPLTPEASAVLSAPEWKITVDNSRSLLPQLKMPVQTEPQTSVKSTTGLKANNPIQPVTALPSTASAKLQPMMLGAEDLPALRDIDRSTGSPGALLDDSSSVKPQNDVLPGQSDKQATDKIPLKKKAEKPPRPVVFYTPLPAIAIFPVVKHGSDIMFSDVSILFAKEFSRRLELQSPGTRILNPYYTVEAMKSKGIDHIYDKLMKEYRYAGRPNPATLDYLLKQLTVGSDRPIARVFFLEADLDINEPMSPKGLGGTVDRIRNAFDGSTSDYMKYYVRSHVQAYDTEDPNMPQVWNFDWKQSVRADRFNNVTTSVFADADALRAFNETSGSLSKAALLILPKSVYMEEHVDTSVKGHLAGKEEESGQRANQDNNSLEPGMQPIGGNADVDQNMADNVTLRARSGKPKRPVAESARQFVDQANRWLH